jgi:methionyl-tRNA formyltransferase
LGANITYAYILKENEHELEKIYPEIESLCQKEKIPYCISRTIKDEKDRVTKLKPDLLLVSGWRTIIPIEILSIPKYGAIAFHESLLPKYRGFAPVNWAVINGEKYTGVSLFYLSEGVDNGDVIAQEKIHIGINDTAYEVYQKTIELSAKMLKRYYSGIISGKSKRIKQNEAKAAYVCARTPEDGRIDWRLSNLQIHNLVRGLSYPYPGAFCFFKDEKIIIQKTVIPKQRTWIGTTPGRIVGIFQNQGVEVLTGNGSIIIEEIEVKQKSINAAKYFNSIKDTLI